MVIGRPYPEDADHKTNNVFTKIDEDDMAAFKKVVLDFISPSFPSRAVFLT
jgi:hypothetical protein